MTRKEEIFLSLAHWIASLDGNLDINEDPIYDIEAGLQIYLPDRARVLETLGE